MTTHTLNDFLRAVPGKASVSSPVGKLPCFPGAWYAKAITGRSMWLGIEATVRLPEFTPDATRTETVTQGGRRMKRHLDTPSVYFGGSADDETDIGFGYFRGKIDGEISDGKIVFRPFWRTIYQENGEEVNRYDGTPIDDTAHYYLPGDVLRVMLICERPDELTFFVRLLKHTAIGRFARLRKKIGDPEDLLVRGIKAPGNRRRDAEYKFVHAIDQYHNEGRPTQPTRARTQGCVFDDVHLFHDDGGTLKKDGDIHRLFRMMFCPTPRAYDTKENDRGIHVDIRPDRLHETRKTEDKGR